VIVPIVLVSLAVIGLVVFAGGGRDVFVESPPTCLELWAIHHGGKRSMSDVRLVVIHSTEGNTASGAAYWFQNEASEGSTHVVVDDEQCFRTLPDDVVPWGARGTNEDGLHVEMAGHASWTREQWLERRRTIQRAAAVAAVWGRFYGIPMRFLDAAALRRGERGVTTHAEVTKAYSGGMGHTDPGKNFPIDVFMRSAGGKAPERMIA